MYEGARPSLQLFLISMRAATVLPPSAQFSGACVEPSEQMSEGESKWTSAPPWEGLWLFTECQSNSLNPRKEDIYCEATEFNTDST